MEVDEGEARKKASKKKLIYDFNILQGGKIIIYVSVSLLAAQSAFFTKIVD